MTNIAFIGLGNMGGPMAANLIKAGHQVTGFDLSPEHLQAAEKTGVILSPKRCRCGQRLFGDHHDVACGSACESGLGRSCDPLWQRGFDDRLFDH